MKRLLTRLVAAVLLAGLLAACSAPPTQRLQARLTPVASLGYDYEVDDDGKITIEIATRDLRFRNPPGAAAVTITGFLVEYIDDSGNFVDGWVTEPNALSVFVPAGFTCKDPEKDEEPDEDAVCTTTSPFAVATPGRETPEGAVTVQLLHSVVIAKELRRGGSTAGWIARLTVSGSGPYGSISEEYTFNIVTPN